MNYSNNICTENLIKKEPHCYCLVFPNYKALDHSTIEDIFSKYGQVISITASGDERGYRFVRYVTLEEAQRAVDNVSKDHGIHLKEHRPRHSSNDKKYAKNNKDKRRDQVDGFKQPGLPVWQREIDTYSDYSSCGDSCCEEPKNQSPDFTQKSQSMNSLTGSEYDSQSRSGVSEERLNQRCHELKSLRQQVFTPCDSEQVPPLVSKKIPKNQKIIQVTAGEVVVGNIPARLGAAYLLHLFERHHPIAISYLEPVSRTNTSYCHVYFRSEMDALRVEREFDKHNLWGTRLVVMRPEKLVKIGAA